MGYAPAAAIGAKIAAPDRLAGEDPARTFVIIYSAAWPEIAALGFDRRFQRMWQYYLSYTEGGFRCGHADVGQIVLEG